MPTIRTSVDDATYKQLVRTRKAEGLPSVSALFLERCGVLDDSLEAAEIVKQAKIAAMKKPDGSTFRLRDLFTRGRWDQFSKGARLRAGRLFSEEMAAALDGIRFAHRSASNHQYYTKGRAAKRTRE